MSRIVSWLGRVAACLAIVSACDGGGSDDSSTHWLADCTSAVDCGQGIACICGVCTKACTTTADCAVVGPSAECIAPASAICSADRVCGMPCAGSGDCEGGLVCVGGACTRPSSIDASVDASGAPSRGGRDAGGQSGSSGGTAAAGGANSGNAGALRDAAIDVSTGGSSGAGGNRISDASARDAGSAGAGNGSSRDGGADAARRDAAVLAHGWEGEQVVSAGLSYSLLGNLDNQVGVAADGTAFSLFQMRTGAPADTLYVNRYVPGAGWDATPVAVNAGVGNQGLYATLAVSDNGDAMVLWWWWAPRPGDGGEVRQLYAAHYAGGWESPVFIGTSPFPSFMSLAADAHGHFVVAWMDEQAQGASAPSSIYLSHYDSSSGWDAPLHIPAIDSRLDPAPYSPRRPSIAMDGDGSALVTWSERRAAGTGTQEGTGWVRAERFTPGPGWSSPDTVSGPFPAPPGNVPCFDALDHGGHAVVLWTESDPPMAPDAAAVSVPSHPMAATFDGTWGSPSRLDPAEGADTFVGPASIGTDSSGHFMATWESRVRIGSALQYSIYATGLTLGGAWSSPTMLDAPLGSSDSGAAVERGNPMLHMSADGTAIVQWVELPSGSSSPASLEAVHFAPASGWSAPTVLAPSVFFEETSGTMDANGNGTIVWRNAADSFEWAARYTSGVGWEAPTRISTGSSGFMSSAIGADGEVVAMWYTGGVRANVYR